MVKRRLSHTHAKKTPEPGSALTLGDLACETTFLGDTRFSGRLGPPSKPLLWHTGPMKGFFNPQAEIRPPGVL